MASGKQNAQWRPTVYCCFLISTSLCVTLLTCMWLWGRHLHHDFQLLHSTAIGHDSACLQLQLELLLQQHSASLDMCNTLLI